VAELTALRIAVLVHARHQYGKGELPEPIGLSINRQGHLTLVFDRRETMNMWRGQLGVGVRPSPPPVPGGEAFRGTLTATEEISGNGVRSHHILTTVVYRP
jgi:hypothetical protein